MKATAEYVDSALSKVYRDPGIRSGTSQKSQYREKGRCMPGNSHGREDRRDYLRLEYQSEERPQMTNKDQKFQVLDMSRTGLRIRNDKEIKPEDWVTGQLALASGQLLDVEGTVQWKHDNEFGLLLTDLIPAAIFEKERIYVISHRL